MPNLKFDFSHHICVVDQSLVNAPPPGGAPPSPGLMYLSKPACGDIYIGARHRPPRQPLSREHLVSRWSSATTEVYWVNKTAFVWVWEFNNCLISYSDYFDKLLRLENIKLFSKQYKILYILNTTILILYRKLYINVESIIIVLNIEARQYNIKINLFISWHSDVDMWYPSLLKCYMILPALYVLNNSPMCNPKLLHFYRKVPC